MIMETEGKKKSHVRESLAGQPGSSSIIDQSVLNGAPVSFTTLLVMLCSLVGSLLFTLTYIIEGVMRPGYDAWRLPVSALSLGSEGWVQQVNFITFGLILLCTVFAVRRVLKGGVGVTWYPIFKFVNALSFIMLGIFSQDVALGYPVGVVSTSTTDGLIHTIFSFVSFIATACGYFVLARRFAMEPRWRGWATYSVISGLMTIVFVALYGTMSAHHSEIAGLFERLSGGVGTLWGLLFIMQLFRIQRAALENGLQQIKV